MSWRYILVLAGSLSAQSALAGNETGTGQSGIVITIQDSTAVIQVEQGSTLAVGRAAVNSGYAIVPLDAFTEHGVQVNWGEIELLQHCGGTDVILSQVIDGNLEEMWIETLNADNCSTN